MDTDVLATQGSVVQSNPRMNEHHHALIKAFLEELQEPNHAQRLGSLLIASGDANHTITLYDINAKFHQNDYDSIPTFISDVRKAVLQQYRSYGLEAPESAAASYLDDRLTVRIALWPTDLKDKMSLDYTRMLWQQEQGMGPSPSLGRRRSSRKSKFTLKQQYMQEVADAARVKGQSKKRKAAQEEADRQALVDLWRKECKSNTSRERVEANAPLPAILAFLDLTGAKLGLDDLTYEGIVLGLQHCRYSKVLGRLIDTLIGGRKKDMGGWQYHEWHTRLSERVTVWYEVEVYLHELYHWQRATEDIPPPPRKGTWRARAGTTYGEGVNLCLHESLGETNPLNQRAFHEQDISMQVQLLYLLCLDRMEWDPKITSIIRNAESSFLRPEEVEGDQKHSKFVVYRSSIQGAPLVYKTLVVKETSQSNGNAAKRAKRTGRFEARPVCYTEQEADDLVKDLAQSSKQRAQHCSERLEEALEESEFTQPATEREMFLLEHNLALQYKHCRDSHRDEPLYA
eukprot:TRINITY_DN10810_c0_g1_i5.p1 TRINITY_DN10810_c0_g1~~TRINITY_DN10810_c0_g1_i5.p1  ORF type:complete len:514 (+),score=53.48 TRINITY_DN10810_c0_g1_i5:120-1661(+)